MHRLRPEDEPEPPEQVAPLSPAVAGAASDERLQLAGVERSAAREVADVRKGPVRLALGDEARRVVVSDRADVGEPDPHNSTCID